MIPEDELFVSLRIRGNIHETGEWKKECNYVDIDIKREEAITLMNFIRTCLENEKAKEVKI